MGYILQPGGNQGEVMLLGGRWPQRQELVLEESAVEHVRLAAAALHHLKALIPQQTSPGQAQHLAGHL